MSSPAAAHVAVNALGMTPTSYGHLIMLAARYARLRLDGHAIINRQTGLRIALSWERGLQKAVAPGVPPAVLLAVPAIPALLAKSRYLGVLPPQSVHPPHVLRYHAFGTSAVIDGRCVDIVLVVYENPQGRFFLDRLVERRALPRRGDGGASPDALTDAGQNGSALDTSDDSGSAQQQFSNGNPGRLTPADGGSGVANARPSSSVQSTASNGSQSLTGGVPVVLPNGEKVHVDGGTGYLMSPAADLGPVAAAGRSLGSTYRAMLNDPESAAGANPYLYLSLGLNVGQGGTFDYQRQGNHITGFTQFPQYRDVSNFNVGLFSQQAGLSLGDTLGTAGSFARLFSNNARPDQPYHLDPRTAGLIRAGYNAGASGAFGAAPAP